MRGAQAVPIRPLTILMGENHTGKTSFLGCYQALHNMLLSNRMSTPARLDFNEAPFLLGSFSDIVSSGRSSQAFTLGAKLTAGDKDAASDVDIRFSDCGGEAVVSQMSYQIGSEQPLQLT